MTGAGPGSTLPRFSLVVCSVDRARLDECVARYRAAFADEAFDLIVIDDARSLAEGYNRGIARARGANIVFSHDDAFPISSAFADRLAAHLEQVDVVGIAGATAALSGFWGYAGQPHTHGHVVASAPEGSHVDLLVWGAASRRVDGIRLLDGCMIAARRDVAVAIGFDAQRFDGFHLYDADFSLRASAAGRMRWRWCPTLPSITARSVTSTPTGTATTRSFSQRTRPASTELRRSRGGSHGFAFADIATAAKEIDEQRIAELTPRLREPGARQA